jgi:hypothetical protein
MTVRHSPRRRRLAAGDPIVGITITTPSDVGFY